MINQFKKALKQRLLWKIIITLWLTTTCTIIANIYITKEISRAEFQYELIESKANRLIVEAIQIFEAEGTRSLKEWYRKTLIQDGLNVVLLNSQLQPIGKPPNERHPNGLKHFPNDQNAFFKPTFPVSEFSLQSSNGRVYSLRVFPSPAFMSKHKPNELHLYRLLSSFFIIFIGSFFLYRSIATPLLVLTDASQKLSTGDFSIRTQDKIGRRKDELGDLSQSFDQMAKQIEDLLESQAKLFRDISHEIRTPLTRQKLAISLARDADNPSMFLSKIETQNDIIERLIEQLLTLMKLENSAQLNFVSIELTELVKGACERADLEISNKALTLNLDVSAHIHTQGSPQLLARALDNILGNAIKYSPEKSVIQVNCKIVGKWAEISVIDHGQGIRDEELSHITRPFYRADSSRNLQTGGFGLGLAITDKIIEQHHGSLTLQNNQPTGLNVTIKLPLSKH